MLMVAKRICSLFGMILLCFGISCALAPQQAFAYTYPSPDSIYFDDVSLSKAVPQGVTYDEGSGIMTLENFHGGTLEIQGDACNFDIHLKGDNVFDVTGVDSDDEAIEFSGTGHNLCLYGYEGSSLTVNYTRIGEDSDSRACAIMAGGTLDIKGHLVLDINMNGIQSNPVRFVGLSSGSDMRINDHAKVSVTMSSKNAKSSYAFNVGIGYAGTLYVFSDKPLYVDMSNMKHANASDKAAFMDNQHADQPYVFRNTPQVTILAEELVDRGFGAYPIFQVEGYVLTVTSGKYVFTEMNGWVKEGDTWYYYDDGVKATGWLKDKGKWYYLDKTTGAMQKGWVKASGTWYYMDSSGAMITGWKKINGTWYCFKKSGAMAASEWYGGYWLSASGAWTYPYKGSWHQNSKGWWFGDTSGWYAKSQTVKINDKKYTFNAAGYMV